MDIGKLLGIVGIVFVGFVAFNLYVLWCHLDFVLNATRLYRQMVRRQDATLQLLLDIRDNTKRVDAASLSAASDEQQDRTVQHRYRCRLCGKRNTFESSAMIHAQTAHGIGDAELMDQIEIIEPRA